MSQISHVLLIVLGLASTAYFGTPVIPLKANRKFPRDAGIEPTRDEPGGGFIRVNLRSPLQTSPTE